MLIVGFSAISARYLLAVLFTEGYLLKKRTEKEGKKKPSQRKAISFKESKTP